MSSSVFFMSPSRSIVVAAFLLLIAADASAKELVYIHIVEPRSALDERIRQHFSVQYSVRIVDESRVYSLPKGVSGHGPPPSVYDGSDCVRGRVLIAYVINDKGIVESPFVIEASKRPLKAPAIKTVTRRRYQPATLDAAPIPVIVASNVAFDCSEKPPVSRS
jgi:TonB-like protein